MKLLMLSIDRKIFEKGSAVALRQIEYAKKYEEVHIIVYTHKKKMPELVETSLGNNIWVYPTRSRSKWLYVFDALKLGRFIVNRREITDVTCQDPFETGLVGTLIKSRHKVNLELQVHVDIGSPYFRRYTPLGKIRQRMAHYTLTKADKVRVVSERIKRYVLRFTDENKIEVRPIFVDTEKIKNAPITLDLQKKYPHFREIILMASRLEPEKNIDMAIRSFKIVLEKIPEAGLVIVGKGKEEEKLKKLVKELNMENSVIFEGWIHDPGTMASYYKTCDCFLLTSWYEGYGMTLVEAQAGGAKIVSTDVGVAREVDATIVGFTPEEIAEGIIKNLV